jgi:hypothetical protein
MDWCHPTFVVGLLPFLSGTMCRGLWPYNIFCDLLCFSLKSVWKPPWSPISCIVADLLNQYHVDDVKICCHLKK